MNRSKSATHAFLAILFIIVILFVFGKVQRLHEYRKIERMALSFEAIKVGMSLDDVVKILGTPEFSLTQREGVYVGFGEFPKEFGDRGSSPKFDSPFAVRFDADMIAVSKSDNITNWLKDR